MNDDSNKPLGKKQSPKRTRIKDIPNWFDLKKYSECDKFSEVDWQRALFLRKRLFYDVYEVFDSNQLDLKIVQELRGRFLDAIAADPISPYLGRTLLGYLKVSSSALHRLVDKEIGTLSKGALSIAAKCWSKNNQSEDKTKEDEKLKDALNIISGSIITEETISKLNTPVRELSVDDYLRTKRVMSHSDTYDTDNSLNELYRDPTVVKKNANLLGLDLPTDDNYYFYVGIDLSASDQSLKNAFDELVGQLRENYKIPKPKRNPVRSNVEQLSRDKILPVIDLLMWFAHNNHQINYELLNKELFDHQETWATVQDRVVSFAKVSLTSGFINSLNHHVR